MRVELLAVYSTSRRAYQPGEEIDIDDRDARRLISRQLAKPVRKLKGERTVSGGGEETVRRGGTETTSRS